MRRARRGLSELLGATIVVAAVVTAAISAALVIDKASVRAARVLELAADPGYDLLVYPIVDSGGLFVYLAPTEPGVEYSIIIIDTEGNSWYTRIVANGTSLLAEAVTQYDCRPVYIIVVDQEGRLYWYTSLRDPRAPGAPRDPRLFTCYNVGDDKAILIPGLLESEVIPVVALYQANKTVVMEPINGSLQRVKIEGYIFDDEINNHKIFICNLTIQIYNLSEEAWIPVGTHTDCENSHLVSIKLSPTVILEIRLAKDGESGRTIFYGVLYGPYEAYLLQVDLYARLRDQLNRLIHVGNPYYTLLIVPQAISLNESKYIISGSRYERGTYIYVVTSRYQGLMLVRDIFLIGYIDHPILSVSSFTLQMNFTLLAATQGSQLSSPLVIPLGEIQPGTALHIDLSRAVNVDGYINTLIDEILSHSQPPIRLKIKNGEVTRVYPLHYGDNYLTIKDGGELYLLIDANPMLSFFPALHFKVTGSNGYDLYFANRIMWTLDRETMPSIASTNTPFLININYNGETVVYLVAIASSEIYSALQTSGLVQGPIVNGNESMASMGLEYCIVRPELSSDSYDPPTAPCIKEYDKASIVIATTSTVETIFLVTIDEYTYTVRIPAWAHLVYLP